MALADSVPLLACEPPPTPPMAYGPPPVPPSQAQTKHTREMMFQKFITVLIVTAAIAFAASRAPALIDFRRGLRVRLLQLAADILGGFLSAHDHRHLDRNARMAARIWQANRGVMARGSGSGA